MFRRLMPFSPPYSDGSVKIDSAAAALPLLLTRAALPAADMY
jgi:hypothetical protein